MQQAMLTDALGYVAAGLVFATFCAKRMALLRALAIVSNAAFIGYGFLDGLWPILVLHSAMLPMNIQRYRQSVRRHCSATTADTGMPVPGRSMLLRNLITVALGRLRSWRERGIPTPTSFMFADGFGDLNRHPNELRCRRSRRRGRRRGRFGSGSGVSRPIGHERIRYNSYALQRFAAGQEERCYSFECPLSWCKGISST
jgi:hypothetical protein